MKKVIIFISLFFTSILLTNAAPCKVISGDGTNIGDEIKCGTENFYVVSNDGETIEMLAKYNLYVGDKIDLISFEEKVEVPLDNNAMSEIMNYCVDLAFEKGYDPYYIYPMIDSSTPYDEDYLIVSGCRIYEELEYEKIRQDERAVGTKLDGSGKSILPLYGITYMNPEYGQNYFNIQYNENGDLSLEDDTPFKYYFEGYKKELESQGINVSNVSFFTLSKTLNLLERISGEKIIVDLESMHDYHFEDPHDYIDENEFYMHFDPTYYISFMDIKKYIGNHDWISSSTFWLGSGFYSGNQKPLNPADYQDYYISNEGFLCAIGRGGYCDYLQYPVGNGLRPLVSIPAYLIYSIETKTDGNGIVKANHVEAEGGTEVKFTVTPNEGYVLGEVKVTDSKGNVVIFKDYTFTMPNANVLIEATFNPITKQENPDTSDFIAIISTILVTSCILLTYMNYKKTLLR